MLRVYNRNERTDKQLILSLFTFTTEIIPASTIINNNAYLGFSFFNYY